MESIAKMKDERRREYNSSCPRALPGKLAYVIMATQRMACDLHCLLLRINELQLDPSSYQDTIELYEQEILKVFREAFGQLPYAREFTEP